MKERLSMKANNMFLFVKSLKCVLSHYLLIIIVPRHDPRIVLNVFAHSFNDVRCRWNNQRYWNAFIICSSVDRYIQWWWWRWDMTYSNAQTANTSILQLYYNFMILFLINCCFATTVCNDVIDRQSRNMDKISRIKIRNKRHFYCWRTTMNNGRRSKYFSHLVPHIFLFEWINVHQSKVD